MPARRPPPRYAELHSYSCFSFLEGASTPEDLVARAVELGLHALSLTDRDGVYGGPRFHTACKEQGLRGVYGSEITLDNGCRVVLLVRDLGGWKNLCRIVTHGRRAAEKGASRVPFEVIARHAGGLIALSSGPLGEVESALLGGDEAEAKTRAGRYRDVFGKDGFYLEQHNHLQFREDRLRGMQQRLARRLGLKSVASNYAHYATRSDRPLQDVMTCIRLHRCLDDAGDVLLPNGEYLLKGPQEMAAVFRDEPRLLYNSVEVAERCRFGLDQLQYRLPDFPVPEGETQFSYLHRLAMAGALQRYHPLTPRVARQMSHELDVIESLGFAGYFLIVWDVVRFCKQHKILCQGRGSAANSAVCYSLGITNVDPVGLDLLFERFLSEERTEAPDIDLDIEHERREEVLQYVYERYGRDHAGMVCTFITYHARSAVRDVGKALGLSEQQVRTATKTLDRYGPSKLTEGRGSLAGLNLDARRLRLLSGLCERIEGMPRHLSIHTGGMVVAATALDEVVPIENATMQDRTVIQWDKDDVAAMGLVKIDLLGLGALTLMHRAIDLLRVHKHVELDLAHLPPDDPDVYDMLCRADTVGVFQVESRAQMNCLPRLRPRRFYDLVIEVALIRPGPIQGKMVHPFLRRRQGKETVSYPHPSLRPILERTLGVPLFQEQGMKIAVAAAGFTPSQADELRRAMGHKRSRERMAALARRLMEGMARRGIPRKAAQRIFEQLAAFSDFGFAESHAASFALLVYATAYAKHHHPEVYAAAILNAQPMGFYSAATLVQDARRHGVDFLPISIDRSESDCTLEPLGAEGRFAVRLGLRWVQGLGEEFRRRVLSERDVRSFASAEDFARRCRLPVPLQETLARLGLFAGFGLERREALWQVQAAARDSAGPLDSGPPREDPVHLAAMNSREVVAEDYRNSGLSLRMQPVQLWREKLRDHGILSSADLGASRSGSRVWVAGLVICRQKPPTAGGFCFLTLEDEFGLVNIVIPPAIYESNRSVIRLEPFVAVRGILEKAEGITNLRAQELRTIRSEEFESSVSSRDYH